MLHLVYRFRPTAKARGDLRAFWDWIADRQLWFYRDLDMIIDTRWHTVTIGSDVHCLEHHVSFADEAAWGRYRAEISRRSQDPDWEQRRTSQDEWYEILDSRILTDPPRPIPLPSPAAPTPVDRALRLLDTARFVTLATNGSAGPWAAPVNFVALHAPVRLLWYSLRSAQHSLDIVASTQVSGSMFLTGLTGDSAPSGIPIDGAQFSGSCRAIHDRDQVEEYHRYYYETNFPDPRVRAEWLLPVEEFHGDGPRRFYLLQVERWWLYDADRWTVDKHDTRIEIPTDSIRPRS
ncbi:hypothetical protein [Nocardia sp. NPDC049526]|uniref:hypothetical protein n=1 Tax=Nocardia sp. NPDC049526 TaxID=3364316 RepID=UPI00379F2FFE